MVRDGISSAATTLPHGSVFTAKFPPASIVAGRWTAASSCEPLRWRSATESSCCSRDLVCAPILRRAVVGTSCNAHASVVAGRHKLAVRRRRLAIRSGGTACAGHHGSRVWTPPGSSTCNSTRGATDLKSDAPPGAPAAATVRLLATTRRSRGLRSSRPCRRRTRRRASRSTRRSTRRATPPRRRRRCDRSRALCPRSWSRRTAEGRPVLLLEDVTAPFAAHRGSSPSWWTIRATHAGGSQSRDVHRALYNDTAEPLRAAALLASAPPREPSRGTLGSSSNGWRRRCAPSPTSAFTTRASSWCTRMPQAGSPLRAAVHLLDLEFCSGAAGARDLRLRPGEAGAQVSLPVALCAGVHLLRGGDRDVASESGAAV